jgi:hypothetical protein
MNNRYFLSGSVLGLVLGFILANLKGYNNSRPVVTLPTPPIISYPSPTPSEHPSPKEIKEPLNHSITEALGVLKKSESCNQSSLVVHGQNVTITCGNSIQVTINIYLIYSDPDTGTKKPIGTFATMILPITRQWVLGSTENMEKYANDPTGTPIKTELAKLLREPFAQDSFKRAQKIIPLGVASCEGDQNKEELRAEDRAASLTQTIMNVTNPTIYPKLEHSFNLGQYSKKPCPSGKSSYQRPIMIFWLDYLSSSSSLINKAVIEREIINKLDSDSTFKNKTTYYSLKQLEVIK